MYNDYLPATRICDLTVAHIWTTHKCIHIVLHCIYHITLLYQITYIILCSFSIIQSLWLQNIICKNVINLRWRVLTGALLARLDGPRSRRRPLVRFSVNYTQLYTFKVRGHALTEKCYRNRLLRVHRAGYFCLLQYAAGNLSDRRCHSAPRFRHMIDTRFTARESKWLEKLLPPIKGTEPFQTGGT